MQHTVVLSVNEMLRAWLSARPSLVTKKNPVKQQCSLVRLDFKITARITDLQLDFMGEFEATNAVLTIP